MKTLITKIEENGLEVTHHNKRNLWVKAKNVILMLDAYELFGLEDDDLMITIKNRFYVYNVKIDIYNPDNNKSSSIKSKDIYVPVDERKQKIRELLTNKYKLLS